MGMIKDWNGCIATEEPFPMEDRPAGYISKIRGFNRDAKLYIVSSVATSIAFGISQVIFNLYLIEVGFSEDFIGFFLSVSLFATAGIAIVAGSLTDRTSRKRVVLLAGMVSFGALLTQYTILEPVGLLLSQVFFGLSSAFVQVAWAPYITGLTTHEERPHLFGVTSGLSLIGVLSGNILGGMMPGLFYQVLRIADSLTMGYRYALWVSLVPYVLSIIVIVPMTPDIPKNDGRLSMGFSHVRNWGFIGRYTLVVATVGLGAGMIVMFFNIFFAAEETFGASTELIGVIFGINTLVLALGSFVSPALSDRIGKVNTVVLTELMSVPFLLMISWAPTLWLAVFAYVARTALMNMAGPVSQAFFMECLTAEERSTASGVLSASDSFVRGIAANIGGWLLAQGLYRLPYVLVSGLYLLAVAEFYVFFRRKEDEIQKIRSATVAAGETKVEIDAT
ncbi:MAG: hypothetical protein DRO93_08460 [Candidatus Thorarchaeota archaeon]|nr:MAG: hypothetical protein DRO93_08460 [Candidatus Thorarchaeota archaeon]